MTILASAPILAFPCPASASAHPEARLLELGLQYRSLDADCRKFFDAAEAAHKHYIATKPELPPVLIWKRTDILDSVIHYLKTGEKVQRVSVQSLQKLKANREKMVRKYTASESWRRSAYQRIDEIIVAHEYYEKECRQAKKASRWCELEAKASRQYSLRWSLIEEATAIEATSLEGIAVKALMIAKHDHSNLDHFSETGAYDEIIKSLLQDLLRIEPDAHNGGALVTSFENIENIARRRAA
jgi:hypothetical protein